MTPEERFAQAMPPDGTRINNGVLHGAIERAQTVKLTPEIREAWWESFTRCDTSTMDALAAAFRAAGFIVEE